MSNHSSLHNGVCGAASANCASNVESTQWTKFHTPNGHGFAAEDFNALINELSLKKVDKVGLNNELNGADRIVNGVKIQTKYSRSAYDSVSNAFDADGVFRYPGMKLEVPKGQGEDAIRIFEERIKAGNVPGVTNPGEARNIVVEGHCTYDQAAKIAKSGNLESIRFDVMNQLVLCTCVAGLSFVVVYAVSRLGGITRENALRSAISQAIKAGATTMVASVAVQQLLRTQVGRQMAAAATKTAKTGVSHIISTPVGSEIVKKMMVGILGKSAAEGAARNAFVKLARSNFFTSAAIMIATTAPDVVKACRGMKSWKQVGKDTVVNVAGIGAGSAGWWAGAAAGSCVFPGVGTIIGGLIGALGAGIAGSYGVKKGMDVFIEDDSVQCVKYVEDAIVSICSTNNLSEEKLEEVVKELHSKNVICESFFEKMYRVGSKNHDSYRMRGFALDQLRPYFV